MKNIKFRAFDKKTKKIFPVSALHGNGAVHIDVYPDSKAEYKNADEVEVMQFTGLLDKNGKEIYEGDILKTNDNSITKIIWNEEKNGWDWIFVGFDTFYGPKDWEIVGNIYENQELLK